MLFTNHKESSINSYLRCVQEVLVVPLLKMRRECSAVGCQVELQVSMTTMQQMNYKCDPDAFYLEQTINRWRGRMNIPMDLKDCLKSNPSLVLIIIIYHQMLFYCWNTWYWSPLYMVWLATHDASESSSIIHSADNPQGFSISVAGESKITAGV